MDSQTAFGNQNGKFILILKKGYLKCVKKGFYTIQINLNRQIYLNA